MTLQVKALLIFILTLSGALILFNHIFQSILLESYEQLDQKNVKHSLEIVRKAIQKEIDIIAKVNSDWAYWDDAYEFVQNSSPEFVQSNLSEVTYANLRLTVVGVFDLERNPIYLQGYDIYLDKKIPVSDTLRRLLIETDKLHSHPHIDSYTAGLLGTSEGALIITSYPILDSEQEKPKRGSLFFGRLIDKGEIKLLQESLNIPLYGHNLLKTKIPFASKEKIETRSIDKSTMSGIIKIPDIEGKDCLAMEAKVDRQVYIQGLSTMKYLELWISGISILFAVVALLILRLFILNRIDKLVKTAQIIQADSDSYFSVSEEGNDEITTLAKSINDMLVRLKDSRQELERSHFKEKKVAQQIFQMNANLEKCVTERTKQLLEAKTAAEEATRSKSQFLANMSHELRTPLNAIIGYSEILIEEAPDITDTKKIIPDAQKICEAGQHLLALINDILDISKIEAGKMDLYIEKFPIKELVQEAIDLVRPLASKNKNTLEWKSQEIPDTMSSDQTKLRQILFNLLSNACKFTEKGQISLSITFCESEKKFCFQVSDTGIGMSLEQRKNLFKSFHQGDPSTSRRYGGTGLGLAISKSFCQILGGEIVVRSSLGKGSTFTLRLPQETIVSPL